MRNTDVGQDVQENVQKAVQITKTVRWDDNGTFFIDPHAHGEFGLSYGDLAYMVNRHRQTMVKHYDKLYQYYRGNHETIIKKPRKKGNNPDNRIILNYPKQIVKAYVGYFAGVNPSFSIQKDDDISEETYNTANKELDYFNNQNNINHFFTQQAKNVDIFGRSLALVYQDEMGDTRLSAFDPRRGFIVYADDVSEQPVFGVRYKRVDNNGAVIADVYAIDNSILEDEKGVRVKTATNYHKYDVVATMDFASDQLIEFEADLVGYDTLPMIEFNADDERMGLYEDVITVFDAIDSAISEKKNDVDYFGDVILSLMNMVFNEEALQQLRDLRILSAKNTSDKPSTAEFLDKPTADQTQENLINRLISSVYDITGVVNLNDKDFTNAASGQALKQRLQGMRQNADTKASSFERSFRKIYKALFTGLLMRDVVDDVVIRFKKNEPLDLLDLSQSLVFLGKAVGGGMVSQETALSTIPVIEDARDEMEKIKAERAMNEVTLEAVQSADNSSTNNDTSDNQDTNISANKL